MNRIGRSCRRTLRFRSLRGIGLAGIGLAVTGCGGGGASAVNAPPASAHTAAERAAVTSWFVQTNQMLTKNDFHAVNRAARRQMRTVYLTEEPPASLPRRGPDGVQLTGLPKNVPVAPAAQPSSSPTPTPMSSISGRPSSLWPWCSSRPPACGSSPRRQPP